MVESTRPLRRFRPELALIPSGLGDSRVPLWDYDCGSGFWSANTCSIRNQLTDFQAWDFRVFSAAPRARHKSQSMAAL